MKFECPTCREEKEAVLLKETANGIIATCNRGHSVFIVKR